MCQIIYIYIILNIIMSSSILAHIEIHSGRYCQFKLKIIENLTKTKNASLNRKFDYNSYNDIQFL